MNLPKELEKVTLNATSRMAKVRETARKTNEELLAKLVEADETRRRLVEQIKLLEEENRVTAQHMRSLEEESRVAAEIEKRQKEEILSRSLAELAANYEKKVAQYKKHAQKQLEKYEEQFDEERKRLIDAFHDELEPLMEPADAAVAHVLHGDAPSDEDASPESDSDHVEGENAQSPIVIQERVIDSPSVALAGPSIEKSPIWVSEPSDIVILSSSDVDDAPGVAAVTTVNARRSSNRIKEKKEAKKTKKRQQQSEEECDDDEYDLDDEEDDEEEDDEEQQEDRDFIDDSAVPKEGSEMDVCDDDDDAAAAAAQEEDPDLDGMAVFVSDCKKTRSVSATMQTNGWWKHNFDDVMEAIRQGMGHGKKSAIGMFHTVAKQCIISPIPPFLAERKKNSEKRKVTCCFCGIDRTCDKEIVFSLNPAPTDEKYPIGNDTCEGLAKSVIKFFLLLRDAGNISLDDRDALSQHLVKMKTAKGKIMEAHQKKRTAYSPRRTRKRSKVFDDAAAAAAAAFEKESSENASDPEKEDDNGPVAVAASFVGTKK